MQTQTEKAQRFHSLHIAGRPLVLFNAWDAGSAAAVARAGAQAIATGSWSVAAANGYPDGEGLPFELSMAILARICAASTLPVTVDLERGYGTQPSEVAASVARVIAAGAVGANLEDGLDAGLRATGEQAARLRAARGAAQEALPAFFINARTDLFLGSDPATHAGLVEEALSRAAAYAAAGADGLFVPGLTDPALIARLAAASPLPVNVMALGSAPLAARMAELGVARISYGPQPYLLAMRALEAAAREAMQPA
jgi:2-methylisocitrate lyase-like PEP mutase family enzyme